MNSLIPAARASSIAYWIRGRSTKVMISFGIDLVAGRKRVPRPATGKTAVLTFCVFICFDHLFRVSTGVYHTWEGRLNTGEQMAEDVSKIMGDIEALRREIRPLSQRKTGQIIGCRLQTNSSDRALI